MRKLFGAKRQQSQTTAEPDAERRQVTVLFYDIVGSTGMGSKLDPEEARIILLSIHNMAKEIITEEMGSLEQVLGDGGMAYFGYRTYSEDAALHAMNAAWKILRARLDIENAPAIRIGIATSVVVAPRDTRTLAEGGLGVVGVAPNLAARLEGATPPNTTLVSKSTYELVRRAFDFTRVIGLDLKGFEDPVDAWQLMRRKKVLSRFEMTRETTQSMVSRKAESTRLRDAWREAQTGTGHALLLEGEPGIGKSRLAHEFQREIKDSGRIIFLQCQLNAMSHALLPLTEMYERAYEQGDDPGLVDAALQTADLLNSIEEDFRLSAHEKRTRIVEGALGIIESLSHAEPVILVAEDIHWADEVTLAILLAAARRRSSKIFILCTARLGDINEDIRQAFETITLDVLSEDEAFTMAEAISEANLSRKTLNWIGAQARGNPLFVSELTQFAVASLQDGRSPDELAKSGVASLRDLLAVRLDNAGSAKNVAQISSVIGQEFPFAIILKLAENQMGSDELEAALHKLLVCGIYELVDDGDYYAFHHNLIREAAYDSQLKSVRDKLHGRIVDIVDAHENLREFVTDDILAQHCLSAGRIERGIELLVKASKSSLALSATEAPRKMLVEALHVARTHDVEPELKLQIIALLGPLITQIDGPRAGAELYEEGHALCLSLSEGQRGEWFPILWGWWFTANNNLIEQNRRSEVLIRDISSSEAPEARLQALHCAWATFFDSGSHERSLQAVEDGLAMYDPEIAERSRYTYGHDAKVCGLGERAQSLWMQGQLPQSRQAITDAVTWARKTRHVPSILHALDMATLTAFYRRDHAELQNILSEIGSLSATENMVVVSAKKAIFAGWKEVREGNREAAAKVLDGFSQLRELGALEDTPIYADIAADALELTGEYRKAIEHLDHEIDIAKSTNLTFWVSELLRHRARISYNLDGAETALYNLDEGLLFARKQKAHMLIVKNLNMRLTLGLPVEHLLKGELLDQVMLVSDCPEKAHLLDVLKA